jgi:DNA-directed RNA polymerase specialized sigma24 family protein
MFDSAATLADIAKTVDAKYDDGRAAVINELNAAARAEWGKDYTKGSGDDHCHTMTNAMKKAAAKWSKARDEEIDECWFGGEAVERAGMIWSLAYATAKNFAWNNGYEGRGSITFAKDVASEVVETLVNSDKSIADGSAKRVICGRAKSRAKNALRNAARGGVKAVVAGKEKGAYSTAEMAVGEAYGDLYNAMAALLIKNKDWFEIVDKAFFKGMTYDAIAKESGVYCSTVTRKAEAAFAFLKSAMAYA